MLHLDEGTITAMLDGELHPDSTRQARKHLATCRECTARFEEAREYFDESNRLVRVLDMNSNDSPIPLVLYPAPGAAPPRRSHVRHFAWAASLMLAIGLGYYANESRKPTDSKLQFDSLLSTTSATARPPATPAATAAATPPAADTGARAAAPAESAVAKDAVTAGKKVEQPRATPEVDARTGDKELAKAGGVPESAAAPAAAAAEPARLKAAPAPAAPPSAAPAAGNLAATAGAVRREDSPAPRAAKPAELRDASAASLQEEKQADGIAAAGSQGARVSAQEAVHSLGGGLHLIEGLTPQRMERLEGRMVAGASADAALIRVVYVDALGQELWLDQQHGRLGARGDTVLLHNSDGSLTLQWTDKSGSWLSLRGNVPRDSLKALARRVE